MHILAALFVMLSICSLAPRVHALYPGGGGGPTTTVPQPYIITTNAVVVTSNPFAEYGGNGALSQQQSAPQTTPVTANVIAYNNQGAQWLITCPATPNPEDSLEYLNPSNTKAIAGDECTTNSAALSSTASLNVVVAWSNHTLAHASLNVNGSLADLSLQNLAYSGESYNNSEGISSANASDGYDSGSNIFDGVPSSKQSGIWTWNAKIANLSNAGTIFESNAASLTYNTVVSGTSCLYSYTFTTQATVSNLKNLEAPVPVAPSTSGTDYISFNNVTYPSATAGQQYGANAAAMLSCYLPNFWTQWHLVGTNGTVDYNGDTQYPACIYQYGKVPEYWGAVNSGGTAQSVYVSADSVSFGDSSVIPYFLYNSSLPTIVQTIGSSQSFLNSSYDIYSLHNLQSPGNFLDPFLLGGTSDGSSIFLNVNGVLAQLSAPTFFGNTLQPTTSPTYNGLQVQSNYFVVQQNATTANTMYGLRNAQAIGASYSISNITNPALFSEASNNNFFVLSSTSGYYYLYGLQYYPAGYFSTPSVTPDQAYTPSDTALESYYTNVTLLQQGGYYLTQMYNVTSMWSSYSTSIPYIGRITYSPTPIAMASDQGGDTFVIAPNVLCTYSGVFLTTASCSGFDLFYVSSSGQTLSKNVTTGPESSTLGPLIWEHPSNASFTVSPTGQYIYLSVRSMPYVFIYTVASTNTGLNVTYLNAINLSYSNKTDNFSITKYLANGGPYNSSTLKSRYSGPEEMSIYNVNDTPTESGSISGIIHQDPQHYPIGLAESQGVLYVLDDWYFSQPTPYSSGVFSADDDILMLRAFTYNGTELPVAAATYDDVIPVGGQNLATGYVAGQLYPPYGLPIAANFTVSRNGNSYTYMSYCAYGCTYSPQNANSLFSTGQLSDGTQDTSWITNSTPPVGPFIGGKQYDEEGNPAEIPVPLSFTADFNNTLYLNAWDYVQPAGNQCLPPTYDLLSLNDCALFYNELAGIHFNPQNYTRLAANPQISYACYLGVNTVATGTTTCTIVANLSMQRPPALGIPDPFSYAESLGSPNAYLSGPLSLSTLLLSGGSGGGGSPSTSQTTLSISPNPVSDKGVSVTITATCQSNTDNCAIDYPNLNTQIATGVGFATNTFTPSSTGEFCSYYANDITAGTTSAGQCLGVYSAAGTGNPTSVVIGISTSISIPSVPTGLAASKLKSDISGYLLVPFSYTYSLTQSYSPLTPLPGDAAACSAAPALTNPPPQQNVQVYTAAPIYANSWLNESLQSGFVIGQYQNNNRYYQANLSDAGLIIPPQIFLNIFSNRIFGEIYINQSVSPRGLVYPFQEGGLTTTPGTPSIQVQYNPAISGVSDVIQVTAAQGSINGGTPAGVGLNIVSAQGGPVLASASQSGTSLTYTLCSGTNFCPTTGNYILEACYSNPTGTCTRLWTAGQYSNTLTSFYQFGAPIGSFTVNGLHESLAIDPYGDVWVNNYDSNTVTELSPTGALLGTFDGSGTLNSPCALAATPYQIFIANCQGTGSFGITVLNDYASLGSLSQPGDLIGAYSSGGSEPYALALTPNDQDLWIANYNPNGNSGTVTEMSTSSYSIVASYTVGPGPTSIAVDPEGNVWVATAGPDGLTEIVPSTGKVYTYPTGSQNVYGVAVDQYGYIWVTVPLSGELLRFSPSGALTNTYSAGSFPNQLTVDGNGNIWVADVGGALMEFSPSGALLGTYTANDDPLAIAATPAAVSTSQNLRVYPPVASLSLVINATHTFNYSQTDFVQSYGSVTEPGFSVEAALPLNPQAVGAACSFCTLPYYYNPANLFSGNSSLSHTGQLRTNLVALFSQFKVMAYLDTLNLGLLYNGNVLGYNRFNYTYTDQFNNTINMPVDADLANITVVSLNVSSVINSSNPNSTIVKISGEAGYYPTIFSVTPSPVPAGSQIFLYYDTNINFYNQTSNALSNPDGYYAYAQQCAFSNAGVCAFADPALTTPPPVGQGQTGVQQAQTINFQTQYNSSGECSPEPNTLLIGANTVECNIFPGNKWGLPTSGTSAQGYHEYCIPFYTNGTGVLTTQLGLINIATATSAGTFNLTFRVCGTGTARVQASYYGYPSNQPQVFYQQPLQTTPSTTAASGSPPKLMASAEYNYSIAPNTTYKSFQIGSYYLSLGGIASILGIAIISGIFCYMLMRGRFTSKE